MLQKMLKKMLKSYVEIYDENYVAKDAENDAEKLYIDVKWKLWLYIHCKNIFFKWLLFPRCNCNMIKHRSLKNAKST